MRRNVARGPPCRARAGGTAGGAPGEAQVTTGHHRGIGQGRAGRGRPRGHRHHHRGEQGDGRQPTPPTPTARSRRPSSSRAPTRWPIELTGFRKHCHRGVVLQVNQRARVDATLAVGGLTEATEVIGAGAAHPHRLRGAGGGDRGARGARAAPERAQLRRRSSTSSPASPPARPARTSPAPPPSTRAAPRTSTRSARRPTRTPGWWTASTTTSTPSTP